MKRKPRYTGPVIPESQIEWIVDRLHVSCSHLQVAREVWPRTRKFDWPKIARKQALRIAFNRHQTNRELYAYVMGGMK